MEGEGEHAIAGEGGSLGSRSHLPGGQGVTGGALSRASVKSLAPGGVPGRRVPVSSPCHLRCHQRNWSSPGAPKPQVPQGQAGLSWMFLPPNARLQPQGEGC